MHATVFKCEVKNEQSDSDSDGPDKETTFAVKICRSDNKEVLDVHETEFNIISLFDHQNLVKAKSFFKDDLHNECHCVVTYVEGKEILDFIQEMDQSTYSEGVA